MERLCSAKCRCGVLADPDAAALQVYGTFSGLRLTCSNGNRLVGQKRIKIGIGMFLPCSSASAQMRLEGSDTLNSETESEPAVPMEGLFARSNGEGGGGGKVDNYPRENRNE